MPIAPQSMARGAHLAAAFPQLHGGGPFWGARRIIESSPPLRGSPCLIPARITLTQLAQFEGGFFTGFLPAEALQVR